MVSADIFADGHDVARGGACCTARPASASGTRRRWRRLGNDRWRGGLRRSSRVRRLRVHRRGLDRSVRDLAARPDQEGRRRTGRRERAARGQRRSFARPQRGEAYAAELTRLRPSCRRTTPPRRVTAAPRGARTGWRRPTAAADPLRPRAAGARRARTRAVRRVVRDVSAVGRHAIRRAAPRSTKRRRVLPYIAAMGFDVLYLPPIHPIGRSFRKGRNNALEPRPGDPGSPWAIGSRRGRPHGDRARARHAGRLRPLRRGREAATGSRSRSTSPSRPRPIIRTCASIPSGSAIGPTARSSTPRTRRRNTRTSIRSISSPADWQALWQRAEARLRVLDRARRDDLPRRQPAHQAVPVLGVGARRDHARAPRRRSSSRRRSRGRR